MYDLLICRPFHLFTIPSSSLALIQIVHFVLQTKQVSGLWTFLKLGWTDLFCKSMASSSSSHALPEEGKYNEGKREVKENVEEDGRKEEEAKTGEKGKEGEEEVKKEGNEKEEHQLQLFAPNNEGIEQQQEDRNEAAQFTEPMEHNRYSRDAYQRLFNLDALKNFVLPHDSSSEDDSSGSEGSVITVEDINDRRSENPWDLP